MRAADYLLAIDQGTTSTRAILFDAEGAVHHIGWWKLGHGRIIGSLTRPRRRNSGSKFRGQFVNAPLGFM